MGILRILQPMTIGPIHLRDKVLRNIAAQGEAGASWLEPDPRGPQFGHSEGANPQGESGRVVQQVKPPGGAAAISSAKSPSPKSSSQRTPRWREMGSKFQFRWQISNALNRPR